MGLSIFRQPHSSVLTGFPRHFFLRFFLRKNVIPYLADPGSDFIQQAEFFGQLFDDLLVIFLSLFLLCIALFFAYCDAIFALPGRSLWLQRCDF